MSLSSSAEQRFKTKPNRTRGARLQSCHINALADNLDPPCVTAAFKHASMDQNTGQLLHATLNQVKCHISSFFVGTYFSDRILQQQATSDFKD